MKKIKKTKSENLKKSLAKIKKLNLPINFVKTEKNLPLPISEEITYYKLNYHNLSHQ